MQQGFCKRLTVSVVKGAGEMIEVNHVTKKYGNHTAVDDLSFQIEDGQIYGLLGPNGAGKSTTMNMLTGYLAPSSGEIRIDGHDIITEPEEAKRQIGYLPELPPVYDAMTTLEYLRFVAELKKIRKEDREEEIQRVCEKTRITDVQNRLIQNLSKGYKQRVGLAQAILGNPKIIILDEPTVGLDPVQIIEIRELIKSLRKSHTVILSSHILPEVSAVCDHIMIISEGKLVASDTAAGLARLMEGDNTLTLKVRIGKTGAESIAKELALLHPQIEGSSVTACDEPELSVITLHYGKTCDLREAVFFYFAEKKVPLYEMELSVKTLEDVFLELTKRPESRAKGSKPDKKWKRKKQSEMPEEEQEESMQPGEMPEEGQEESMQPGKMLEEEQLKNEKTTENQEVEEA